MTFEKLEELYARKEDGTATEEELEIIRQDAANPNGYLQHLRKREIEFFGRATTELKKPQASITTATKGRGWQLAAIASSVLLLITTVFSGIVRQELAVSSANYRETLSELQTSLSRLSNSNDLLQQSQLQNKTLQNEVESLREESESAQSQTASLLRDAEQPGGHFFVSAPAGRAGTPLRVTILNATLTVRVRINGIEHEISQGNSAINAVTGENGKIRIEVLSLTPFEFFQMFQIFVGGQQLGSTSGVFETRISGGEQIVLNLHAPTPPWNSTIRELDGTPMLLNMRAPARVPNPPNSIELWQKLGREGVLKELAREFIATRDASGETGVIGIPSLRTNLVTATENNNIAAPFDTITEEELIPFFDELLKSHESKVNLGLGRTFGEVLWGEPTP